MTLPCPICFEVVEESEVMRYATMSNHSWQNSTRCDAHGICRPCMARYVEIQILEEGHFNPRCPGEGCPYRLVPLDIERSLESSQQGAQALERFERLRSECHEGRLKEILSQQGDVVNQWLLSECQPCPHCLTMVRRESGCLHVFCRCGCDFCFGCGGPDPSGCICHYMEKRGNDVVFAAWLRTSPESSFEWLWDSRSKQQDEERFLTTLHFWLWMARFVPAPWESSQPAVEDPPEYVQGLEPIQWRPEGGFDHDELSIFDDCITDIEGDEEDDAFGPFYPRVPQKPMRRHCTQRQSRREDRHTFHPLRWSTVRMEGADGTTMAVPLQPQRQPRAVAVQTRSARRRVRQVETRSRRPSNCDLED